MLEGRGKQYGCNLDRCPACGEAMWSLVSLVEIKYSGYDGTDFVLVNGLLTPGTDAHEHKRLNEFTRAQDLKREEDDANRAIDEANKKLVAVAKKKAAR
jgi:hypothetical protein